MKSYFKLTIFAVIIIIIMQVIFSFSPIKSIIAKISPTDYVEKEILFKEYTTTDTPYTLNIYTDISEKDFPYSEENQLSQNVANYAPNKITILLKPNVGHEINKLKEYTNLNADKIAVLMDSKGYIISSYAFPLNKQLILSNLINIANIK